MDAIIFDIQKFCLHDGPGIRTTVFFKGCNLRCKWCANPESWIATPESLNGKICGEAYSVDDLCAEILKDKSFFDKSGGGVTLSGGEPLMQADFIMDFCDKLKGLGVNVAIETAACADTAIFSKVIERLDYIQIDLKHYNSEAHERGTGVGNEKTIANIKVALASKRPVVVRIPAIPNFNSSLDDAHEYVKLLKHLGAKTIHILPFHQFGEKKHSELNPEYAYTNIHAMKNEELDDYKKILENAGFEVQIGG